MVGREKCGILSIKARPYATVRLIEDRFIMRRRGIREPKKDESGLLFSTVSACFPAFFPAGQWILGGKRGEIFLAVPVFYVLIQKNRSGSLQKPFVKEELWLFDSFLGHCSPVVIGKKRLAPGRQKEGKFYGKAADCSGGKAQCGKIHPV